jgi:hypothetical protein
LRGSETFEFGIHLSSKHQALKEEVEGGRCKEQAFTDMLQVPE